MNKKKRRNMLFTMLLLVMALLIPQWTWAQTASQPSVGDGSTDNPYIITKAEELAWFRERVNGGERSICAKIADDVEVIDLKEFCHAADASQNIEELSWKPIGNSAQNYYGTFDGNGKIISNLYINASDLNMGFFGYTWTCTIKNLIFENASVTNAAKYTGVLAGCLGLNTSLQNIIISASCQVNGDSETGGIAGKLDGNASNCENHATVQGTEYVGGIFGNYSRTGNSMIACANYGKVTATSQIVGGLVGYFGSGTIQDCANYGEVIGPDRVAGMAGYVYEGKIQNVFSYGGICATKKTQAGMAFGYSSNGTTEGLVAYYSGAKLTVNGQETTAKAFGTGNLSEVNATGFTEAQLKSGVVAYLLQQSASSENIWGQNLGDTQNAYPVLGSIYKVYLDGNVTLSCTGTLNGQLTNSEPETEGTFKTEHTGSKTHHEAVDATCIQDGSIEYWTCSDCNRIFSDEQLTQEVSSITTAATGHNYDTEDRCTKCQQTIPVLTLGNNKINIGKAVGTRNQITGYDLFKYTPKEDGELEVTASSGKDTYGTLWGSRTDSNPLISDDSGNGNDFKLTYTVTKGTTYYIGARDYYGNAIDGDVTLNVKMNGREYVLPEGMTGWGTEEEPFVIKAAEHLAWFRERVNGGDGSICAKIADDVEVIDLKEFCHAANASQNIEELSWKPIGNSDYMYHGTFDGNGKTISNLYINACESNMGFFGYTYECTIKNLIFENASVTNTDYYTGVLAGCLGLNTSLQNIYISASCQVNGGSDTGGIAGRLEGNASNCENHATVQGTEDVGGIFGSYSRTGNSMTACANYGNVTATSQSAGGLVGYFYSGTIQDCANYGNVEGTYNVGGMAGFIDKGKIQNVFCYGSVSATDTNTDRGGMACGYSNSGSAEGIVAYYSGATLTINGETQETRAFGSESRSNLTEDKAAGYTKEQIASGEVAYLLNGSTSASAEGETLYWYQKLGDNADAYPVLTSTGNNTVYKATLISCDGVSTFGEYANNPEGDKLSHNYQMAETPDEGTTKLYSDVCTLCKSVNKDTKYIKDLCGIEGNNVILTAGTDGSYTATEPVSISDATAYDSPVDFTAQTLNYTRNYLGNNKWQAVYVPFDTEATDWTDNGITAASINNFHEYELEDGSYETVLEVKKATSGVLEANTPYVMRSSESESESKTVTINDAKLHKAESKTYYCMSMTRRYDFTGIYEAKNGFNSDKSSSVAYVLGAAGTIGEVSSAATLYPQRWYLAVSDRNSSGAQQTTAQVRSIRIDMIGEGNATGINDVQVTTTQSSTGIQGIYDLQGRRLSHEPAHGIYVKNGKKYIK